MDVTGKLVRKAESESEVASYQDPQLIRRCFEVADHCAEAKPHSQGGTTGGLCVPVRSSVLLQACHLLHPQ